MFFKISIMFDADSSEPLRFSVEQFKKEVKKKILELGGGQGRDILFFGKNDFQVDVIDYSESSVIAILNKA